MAAPMKVEEIVKSHHKRQELCSTRAKYREGRKPKAVKVYTVNQESKYLLIQGMPSVGAHEELKTLSSQYGQLDEFHPLHEYPAEEFTEVYILKYKKIKSARIAKRKLDDFSFYGGVLHVCYAPEYESVDDTRDKLQERRMSVAKRIKDLQRVEQQGEGATTSNKPPWNDEEQHIKQVSHTARPTIDYHQFTRNTAHSNQFTNRTLDMNGGHSGISNSRVEVGSKTHNAPAVSYSNTQGSFREPATTTAGTQKTVGDKTELTHQTARSGGKLDVRLYKVPKTSAPKFVPRQLTKTQSGDRSNVDLVNASLKRDALRLTDEAGPNLSEEEQSLRKKLKLSITGESSIDKTRATIRTKLSQIKRTDL